MLPWPVDRPFLTFHADGQGDPLWGLSGTLQRFAHRPASDLMGYLLDMLASRPKELEVLVWDHLSPASAELLTSKMEERAAQDNGRVR